MCALAGPAVGVAIFLLLRLGWRRAKQRRPKASFASGGLCYRRGRIRASCGPS